MENTTLLIALLSVSTLGLGGLVGFVLRKKILEREASTAAASAKAILEEA